MRVRDKEYVQLFATPCIVIYLLDVQTVQCTVRATKYSRLLKVRKMPEAPEGLEKAPIL